MYETFDDKVILVTGGTGSFGYAFVKAVLDRSSPKKLIVFSRDEIKQWDMANDLSGHENLRFFIGDVRDKERLRRALIDVDIVVHAAATKIVSTSEYDPFECVKTNILGAMNVIDTAIDCGVDRVIALSTDKACYPVNLYGATKLTSDKLFVSANSYSKPGATRFAVVRYGNVIGSRGSVVPFFQEIAKDNSKEIPITDVRMTRFVITLEDGINLVAFASGDMIGGEIYVKKIPSISIVDLAEAIAPGSKIKEIGIRPGEKLHEMMISEDDATYTYEYLDHYKILPALNNWHLDENRIKNGARVPFGFQYSSDRNPDVMGPEEFRQLALGIDV